MYTFSYSSVTSLTDAVEQLQRDEDAKLVAGGMTLLPTMKLRLAKPSQLIDLTTIAELNGIDVKDGRVTIGAATRHSEVANSKAIAEAIPALCSLANGIGDPQVRNRGTLGGSIANNDPAADYPAAVVALAATVNTDRRAIAADDFFTDMFETALADDEIITGCDFEIPDRAAYLKFPNPASRYAIVGIFVARFRDAVRVAVTGAGPCVYRFAAAEQALSGSFTPESVESLPVAAEDFNEDLHASAVYRAQLVSVLTKRAVAEIC